MIKRPYPPRDTVLWSYFYIYVLVIAGKDPTHPDSGEAGNDYADAWVIF